MTTCDLELNLSLCYSAQSTIYSLQWKLQMKTTNETKLFIILSILSELAQLVQFELSFI